MKNFLCVAIASLTFGKSTALFDYNICLSSDGSTINCNNYYAVEYTDCPSGNIVLPCSVTTITGWARSACTHGEAPSFNITGEGVKSIGEEAFQGTKVVKAVFPSLTSVGSFAFGETDRLDTFETGSETVIGESQAFDGSSVAKMYAAGSIEYPYMFGSNTCPLQKLYVKDTQSVPLPCSDSIKTPLAEYTPHQYNCARVCIDESCSTCDENQVFDITSRTCMNSAGATDCPTLSDTELLEKLAQIGCSTD